MSQPSEYSGKASCSVLQHTLVVTLVFLGLELLVGALPATAGIVVDGACSLHDAIVAANTDSPVGSCPAGTIGPDRILLTVPVVLSQSGHRGTALPSITSDIRIDGNDQIILRLPGPLFRFFFVEPSGRLTLSRLSLVSGAAASRGDLGGAIFNDRGTVIEHCTIEDSSGFSGGAIYSRGGRLEVTASELRFNSGLFVGGAIGVDGAGELESVLILRDSVIANNMAARGGGGVSLVGLEGRITAEIERTSFEANAGDQGAGLIVDKEATVTIVDSMFRQNSASREGGGMLAAGGPAGRPHVTVERTTFVQNRAPFGGGAALFGAGTTLVLRNSTVSANEGDFGGALTMLGPSIVEVVGSSFVANENVNYESLEIVDARFESSLFARDVAGVNCVASGLMDRGGNLADDETCATIPSGLVGVDPVLADNGGLTPTHALLETSEAIDAAGDCGLLTDQRGVTRPSGLCDSGAFELDLGPCFPLMVSHTGQGLEPVVSPLRSLGCRDGEYHEGEAVEVSAAPDAGWEVSGWTGTDDDASTSLSNVVTMPASAHAVSVDYAPIPCFALTLGHTGNGSDPVASPSSSPGCMTGEYHAGETIQLGAVPAAGWEVGGWSGTGDDGSTSPSNTLSMPGSQHAVSVQYVQSCFALTVGHTGIGSSPSATPSSSSGCMTGEYHAGETIQLAAMPAAGWHVTGWSGTAADTSTSTSNSLVMPAQGHAVLVSYAISCFPLVVSHTGMGSTPSFSPPSSAGCGASAFHAGERVTLAAAPAPGWLVSGWTGTEADGSVERENALTMPAGPHQVSVAYVELLFGDGFESGNTEAWSSVSP